MDVYLSAQDISQMPEPGRTWFLNWLLSYLETKKAKPSQSAKQQRLAEPKASQLTLKFGNRGSEPNSIRTHVTLAQLFDAGIIKAGMAVRVRLKRNLEKSSGRGYVSGFEISAKGNILSDSQEFSKPSPLATKINRSSVGGWEYIEIKKDGHWVRLEELREIWKKTNG